jgi:uncharacterized membrane protein YozB (DUF420 family)
MAPKNRSHGTHPRQRIARGSFSTCFLAVDARWMRRTQTATHSRSSHCIVSCATLTFFFLFFFVARSSLLANRTALPSRPRTELHHARHVHCYIQHVICSSHSLRSLPVALRSCSTTSATAADFLGASASTLHTIPDHEKKFQLQPSCCSELG